MSAYPWVHTSPTSTVSCRHPVPAVADAFAQRELSRFDRLGPVEYLRPTRWPLVRRFRFRSAPEVPIPSPDNTRTVILRDAVRDDRGRAPPASASASWHTVQPAAGGKSKKFSYGYRTGSPPPGNCTGGQYVGASRSRRFGAAGGCRRAGTSTVPVRCSPGTAAAALQRNWRLQVGKLHGASSAPAAPSPAPCMRRQSEPTGQPSSWHCCHLGFQ